MLAIDRTYVAVALLWAVVGMLLGFYMGIAADTTLLQMHVAIMLSGFVTLAIYGVIYRLWPSLKNLRLALVQFWLAIAGSAAIIVGSYFYATSSSIPLAAAGSAVFIVAAAMMAWLFVIDSRGA